MSKVSFNFLELLLIVSLCCNTFCNNRSSVFQQLEQVDELLSSDRDSTAAEIFLQIPQPKDSSCDLAYYNYILVRIKCRNNELLEPKILDYSIKWLSDNEDFHRLAYAYNYKSSLLLDYSSDKYNALIYNDKAEVLMQNIDDDLLKYNVYSNRSYIDMYYHDTQGCINSSLKALEIAQRLQDGSRIAHAALLLAMCYCEQKQFQEAEKYTDKCLNFIDYFNDIAKSMVYNTLGDIVKSKDSDLALKYYHKSNSIKNNPDANNSIAVLYLEQNKMEEAEKHFQKSLRPNAYESNTKLMKIYADKLFLTGNTAKTLEIYKRISSEKDSLLEIKNNNFDLQTRKLHKSIEYNDLVIKNKDKKLSLYKILLICLSFVTITISVLYIALRHKKNIELSQQLQYISRGEILLGKIKSNENISQWSKTDREFLLSYYKSINLEFSEELARDYDSLPVNSQLLLLFQNMGKNKQEIISVMGFSDQAYRSLKSRTEKAKK